MNWLIKLPVNGYKDQCDHLCTGVKTGVISDPTPSVS